MVCVCVPFVVLIILLQTRFVNKAIRNAHGKMRARIHEWWARARVRDTKADAGPVPERKGRKRRPSALPQMPDGPATEAERARVLDWFYSCAGRQRGVKAGPPGLGQV